MFFVDIAQHTKIREFTKIQSDKLYDIQKENGNTHCYIDESGIKEPYLGAIGGGLTYQFTETGLGCVLIVIWCKGSPYEASLDVTDYDNW